MQQAGKAWLPVRTPPAMVARPVPAANITQHLNIGRSSISARYMTERRRREMLLDNLTEDEGQGTAPDYPTLPSEPPLQQQQAADGQVSTTSSGYEQNAQNQPPVSSYSRPAADRPAPSPSYERGTPYTHSNMQPSSSDSGWDSRESPSSGSSDDGGWGEAPVHNQDWGDYSPQYHNNHSQHQQYPDQAALDQREPLPTPTDGRHAAQPSSSWDAGPEQYTPGSSEASYNQGAQPHHEVRHPHPYLNDNVSHDGTDAGPAVEWQFFADGVRPGMGFDGAEGAPPQSGQPSDVTLLSRSEMDAVLPMTPTGRQADYFRPHNLSERIVQLVGSLGASMLLSKSTVLAAPALLYPLWSPWIRAALKNVEVYGNQLKTLGLWRAQVLEVEVLANNTFRPGWSGGLRGAQRNPYMSGGAVVRLLMGDPWEGGARVQMEFPYQPKAELLCPGESVEALVLAKDTAFYAFKVIREVYAPGLGLWLTEYPFVDRTAFLDVSLQIERARQADMDAAWQQEDPATASQTFVVDVDVAEPTQSWDFAPPDSDGANPMYSATSTVQGYSANLANTLEDISTAAKGVAGTTWSGLSQAGAAAAGSTWSGLSQAGAAAAGSTWDELSQAAAGTTWSGLSQAGAAAAGTTWNGISQAGAAAAAELEGSIPTGWGSMNGAARPWPTAGDTSQSRPQVHGPWPVADGNVQGPQEVNGSWPAANGSTQGAYEVGGSNLDSSTWQPAYTNDNGAVAQAAVSHSQPSSSVPSGWDEEDHSHGVVGGSVKDSVVGSGDGHVSKQGRIESGWGAAAAAAQ